MSDVAGQRKFWNEVAPPLNIAMLGIAAGLGVKLTPDKKDELKAHAGPSILELSKMATVQGDDTSQASNKILRAAKVGAE